MNNLIDLFCNIPDQQWLAGQARWGCPALDRQLNVSTRALVARHSLRLKV